jgi:hypothetical protein
MTVRCGRFSASSRRRNSSRWPGVPQRRRQCVNRPRRLTQHRSPTWTHPGRHFQVVDEWVIGRDAGPALHADGGSEAAPIHSIRRSRSRHRPECNRSLVAKAIRKAHIARMATTWEIPSSHLFHCPYCEAGYTVRYTHSPTRDSESAYCEVCHRKMSQWNSTEQPSYTLIKRPPRNRTGP